MPPLLLIKIILCASVAGDLAFIREYWTATRGGWARDAIGLTLMLKDLALLMMLSLIVLSVFFHLSRLTSETVAWIQDGLLAFIAGVFFWRTLVFRRERERIAAMLAGKDTDDRAPVPGDSASS